MLIIFPGQIHATGYTYESPALIQNGDCTVLKFLSHKGLVFVPTTPSVSKMFRFPLWSKNICEVNIIKNLFKNYYQIKENGYKRGLNCLCVWEKIQSQNLVSLFCNEPIFDIESMF